jgi:hypothetical protein
VPRTRTTKKLAQRIDLNYFQRSHPLRQWRFWLSVALSVLAAGWLGWHALRGDARVYSSGRMSAAHAILTARCEVCHVRTAGGFSARATDAACLSCHDAPAHHADAVFTPSCASCHVEHRGEVRLTATADAACTQCHADLRTAAGAPRFFRTVTSFAAGHPEFAVLRDGRGDPTAIKLDHYRHMQPNLAGPHGPVQLVCQDCHRTPADRRGWRFGEARFRVAAAAAPRDPLAGAPSAAYMAVPTYAKACAGCHTLEFDKRFSEGVPHDAPEVIHKFLVEKFTAFIVAHPAELRVPRQPDRNLPERPIPPSYRLLTPAAWIAGRTADAERLLWGKTCKQCHELDFTPGQPLPAVAPSRITVRFMPHARFDHAAHQMLRCTSCHAGATSSRESAQLLLPGIATCRQCHRPGTETAESRCFECHTYHNGAPQRAVPGRFTLPQVLSGAAARPRGGVVFAANAKD